MVFHNQRELKRGFITVKDIWIEVLIYIDGGLDTREDPNLEQLIDIITDFTVSHLGRGVIVEDDVVIKAYCTPDEMEAGFIEELMRFLEELNERHGGYLDFHLDTRPIHTEDWSEGWKAHFKPIKIGHSLVIKPTWEEYVPHEGEIVVEIDPGQAFGTGTHATTRLCLELLEEYITRGDGVTSVLDCGTGTGILGISCAKLGVREVLMLDIDPVAAEVARHNCQLNHVQQYCSVTTTPIWEIQDTFDLVVANLDKGTLLLLAQDLTRVISRGGALVVSGILEGQGEAIIERFESLGLVKESIRKDREDPEWIAISFRQNDGNPFDSD